MNKKEVSSIVAKCLKACLEPEGYKYSKSQNQIKLKVNNFTYTISNSCVDRNPEFTIEFFIKIRNDEVENIANKFSYSNPDYFMFTSTIIVRLSYFTGKLMEFTVVSENDIQNIFNNFFGSFYIDHIKPFFEKYSAIKELSKIINDSITKEIMGIPTNTDSYQRNIILLKLTNNSDFENRVRWLREKIKDYPDIDKKMFEDTYNYLKLI